MTSMRWLWCGLTLLAAATAAAQTVAGQTAAGQTVATQQGGKTMQIRVGKDAADFLVGDALATRYLTAGYAKPIFWPVQAPGGQALTRDWPMGAVPEGGSRDHPHQKSLWFCHGDVIPEGMPLKYKIRGVEGVDFWSEAPGHGRIVCTKVGAPHVADGHGVLATHNEWRTADGTKILDEERTIHCYDLGKARLLVLRIDLLASVTPITFGDTKEGAMGVRINDVIRAGKFGPGKIEDAHGKVGEKECWGQVADWCDYSGPVDGKTVGLAVLADPKNAYPSCWHVRDYGLMAANPFGRKKSAFPGAAGRTELVRLAKGDHLELRYGVLLHDGDATAGQVAAHYQQFVKLRGPEKPNPSREKKEGSMLENPSGLVTVASTHSAAETTQRLETALTSKGVQVFAKIDHAAGARQASLALRYTQLLVFGNPHAGTPLMQSNQTIGLDLPLRALVWEDAIGKVWLTYDDPQTLATRHQIHDRAETIRAMRTMLQSLAHAATAP